VACPSHGHLFCRECAISNLLAQNTELKRLKRLAEQRKLEDADEKSLEDAENHSQAVAEFERVQAGLSARPNAAPKKRAAAGMNGKSSDRQEVEVGNSGVKRKFESDESKSADLAQVENGKSQRRESGQDGGNAELPAFWVPSRIPDHKKADLKIAKQQPTCPAAAVDQPHDFSLKTLITVRFGNGTTSGTSGSTSRTCPSCDKALSNSSKAVIAKPCGHVLCKSCSDKFQKPPEKSAHEATYDDTVRCYVCQEDITPGSRSKRKDKGSGEKEAKVERGLVELSTDGTGFAGGGKNMVKKHGLAFQC